VRERSGLIWTYIGPREKEPPFRHFAFDDVPATHRRVMRVNIATNYLQLWEGGTDSSHVGILHSNVTRPGWLGDAEVDDFAIKDMVRDSWDDMAPKLEIENTGFGYHYVGVRKLSSQEGRTNVRLTPVFLPTGRIIMHPNFYATVFDTPLDDENTATFLIDASESTPLDLAERIDRSGLRDERFYQDLTFCADESERWNQDRQAMREKRSWSGFHGLTQEDSVVSLSMGPVFDRSSEHLVAADAAVVRLRQRLLDSVALSEEGADPLGVNMEDMSLVAGFDRDLGPGESWREFAAGHLEHYPAEA
jgi:hypothetical protein